MFFNKKPKKNVEDMTDQEFNEYINKKIRETNRLNIIAITISILAIILKALVIHS